MSCQFLPEPTSLQRSKASFDLHLLLKFALPGVHGLHPHFHSGVTRTATPAGDEVLAAAASHVHSILHQFNQQNLALTLWAFAKLAWCPPTDLLSDAASLAVASLHTSNSQNLSNTLWAFATLGFMPQAGLLEVCQASATCLGCWSRHCLLSQLLECDCHILLCCWFPCSILQCTVHATTWCLLLQGYMPNMRPLCLCLPYILVAHVM